MNIIMFMASLSKHAHILFNEEDYRYLQRLARSQRKPLGELIRAAVRKIYGKKETALRAEAGKRLMAKRDLRVSDWDQMEEDLLARYG